MLSVALTGNVASGKTAVSDRWRTLGVPVVDADQLAREAVEARSDGLQRVVEAFGPDVLTADGQLDRARVRDLVFEDPTARTRLEEIIHPIVWTLRERWLNDRRAEGASVVVSEIPLLFETGREGDFDVVVLVDAPVELRLERMVRDRGLDPEEARRIIESQMSTEKKRERADFVMDNVGSLPDLELMADRVLAQLRARSGDRMLRIDLHLHTEGSRDCLSDAEQVLERALTLGYGRVAITDHDKVHVALRMAEAYPDRIIPGEEVKTAEGIDVIGLYVREEIPKGTPAEETIARIRDQGGIPYLPHPYAAGKGGGGRFSERLAPLCDVVEVFNARLHARRMNDAAYDLAVRHVKLRGAGSDAHTLREVGNAFVDLPAHPNQPDALRAALAQGRTGGREASRLVHLASTWAKVRKRLP
ncbi:MAG: dephospho-CoA kinase [Gemmatimonadota bacterium]|nr:dephospho-CoA kinase [Gemmatimonadota bacterium]